MITVLEQNMTFVNPPCEASVNVILYQTKIHKREICICISIKKTLGRLLTIFELFNFKLPFTILTKSDINPGA